LNNRGLKRLFLLVLKPMKRNKLFQWLAMPVFVFSLLGMSGVDLLDEPSLTADVSTTAMKTLHDFTIETLQGETFDLSTLKGKKVLVVNTASECGLTPQYAQLQELYEKFGGENFEIVGFPSNDFAGQEPGSNDEIASFCQKNYGVTFPMMTKIQVKGDGQHPIYQWLTSKAQNGVGDYEVQWNFHKFLVDEEGRLVKDVAPQTAPIDPEIIDWINS
jgi:glutathione peroxidase